MKKIFLLLIILLGFHSAWAHDVVVNGVYYNLNKQDRTATVTYRGSSPRATDDYIGEVLIPDTIICDGVTYNVNSIGEYAFYTCNKLTRITCKCVTAGGKTRPFWNITSIGDFAFYECEALQTINALAPLTSIGRYAFYNCKALSSFYIPNTLKSIGENAFYRCTNIKSVNIASPSALYYIKFSNKYSNPLYYGHHLYYERKKPYPEGKPHPNITTYETVEVDSIDAPEGVSSIGDYTFVGCHGLVSAIIPSSITSIGVGAFEDCDSLKNIIISDSVKKIGMECFSSCSRLTSITIPNSVTSLGNGCFQNCQSLESVILSDSLTSLPDHCFQHCDKLANILIPNSVDTVFSNCFEKCASLTKIILPESVKYIGDKSFADCSSLKILAILSPEVTIGGTNNGVPGTIFAYPSVLNSWRGTYDRKIAITNPYYAVRESKSTLFSIQLKLYEIKHYQSDAILKSVQFNDSIITPVEDLYKIPNLLPNTTYNIDYYILVNGNEQKFTYTGTTRTPQPNFGAIKLTQSTMIAEIEFWSDDAGNKPTHLGLSCDGKTYETTNLEPYGPGGRSTRIGLTNLVPNHSYECTPYVKYLINGKVYTYTGNTSQYRTLGVSPRVGNCSAKPTSIDCKGQCTIGSATYKNGYFTIADKIYQGDSLTITGLEPNTIYALTYTVETEEGSIETSPEYRFTTPALELTTLQPKCVSSSCAIVAATTNISEEERNVGFQWKKYDAPESLKPNEAYAAIYDGQLEGYLKNLQSAFYYNVRAFYKSNDGTYYYGDWVTFDPSDFSYFEPTVHTYPATQTTDCTASVRGYVLAGTDNITEQGFEYWETNGASFAQKLVKNALLVPSAEDINVVLSTGQVMQVVLDGLKPQTTYTYRAFVRTTGGTTYGEEQTFTTEMPTGIDYMETEKAAPTIVGYYDLSGRQLASKQRGLVIVRYSDGTSRKVMVK